jgi:2-iminobutanoate/2-iminopropanoate deaminase
MRTTSINSRAAPAPAGGYSQATFLSSREFALENREVRQQALGTHAPALTVVITGIFDEKWLLEIEAVAAA